MVYLMSVGSNLFVLSVTRIPLLSRVKMVEYSVTVYTSDRQFSDTSDYVYITLVGTDDESEQTQIPNSVLYGVGSELTFTVSCASSIGELELIKLDKQNFLMNEDSWFPDKVVVKSPEEETFTFPVYCWITDTKEQYFKEGTARTVKEDTSACGKSARERELKEREKNYCWYSLKEGIPHCIKADDPCELPPEITFSYTKKMGFAFTAMTGWLSSKFRGLIDCKRKWTTIDNITHVFNSRTTDIA
ncbi:hypothetical protein ILYODFUR_032959, partial [Ilyodon furcidens]